MSIYVTDKNGNLIKLSSIRVVKEGGGSPKFGELVNGSIQTVESGDLSEINEIRSEAFLDCKNLTSADIPSNITTIGASAFEGCTSLQSLNLADGVQTIGASAFKGINASVVNIPNTLSVLENDAFADNLALTSITIPENVTEIKNNAFGGCTNLTEITMESLTPPSVSDTAFPSSITAIYVKYGAYDDYKAQWSAYADKTVRLPAIPSTITVTVNNYLGELVSGATVTIAGNGQTYTGTTNENGVFVQGDLQPATYTISVADLEGFGTPDSQQVEVVEDSENSVTVTYEEKILVVPFGQATPQMISEISAEISAKNMTSAEVEETYGWKIGNVATIILSTGETIYMGIIGFNHDDKSDGTGKAGITLQMTQCLATRYQANTTNTNAGGYAASVVKTSTLPTIKATLPQEWQNVIKMVDKKSANGGINYSETLTLSEDLFLLSAVEVFGDQYVSVAQDGINEGTQYERFVGAKASVFRKNYDSNGDGVVDTSTNWRSRSCGKDSKYFVEFTSGSYPSAIANNNANYYSGISFAFCV